MAYTYDVLLYNHLLALEELPELTMRMRLFYFLPGKAVHVCSENIYFQSPRLYKPYHFEELFGV